MRLGDKNEKPAGLLRYVKMRVLNGEIDKKEYKNKHKFFQKKS